MLFICKMSLISLIERLKIMEQGLHNVFIEVVVWKELVHKHEYWIAVSLSEEPRNHNFLPICVFLRALKDSYPFHVLVFLLYQLKN